LRNRKGGSNTWEQSRYRTSPAIVLLVARGNDRVNAEAERNGCRREAGQR
jgi:hypothetical protein